MTIADQSFKGTPKFQSYGGGAFEARAGGVSLVYAGSFEFTDPLDDINQVGHVKSGKLSKIGLNEGFNLQPRKIIEYKKKLYVLDRVTTKKDASGSYGRVAVLDEATGVWGTVGPNGVDFDSFGSGGPHRAVIHNGDLIMAGTLGYFNTTLVDDTTACIGIIKWDGENYSQLAGGGQVFVNAIESFQGSIYVTNSQNFP